MSNHDKERLLEIEQTIRGWRNTIAATQSALEQPEVIERLILERRRTIANLEAQIAQDLELQREGPALIERSRARISELVEERKLIVNRVGIERMAKLYDAMNELREAGVTLPSEREYPSANDNMARLDSDEQAALEEHLRNDDIDEELEEIAPSADELAELEEE